MVESEVLSLLGGTITLGGTKLTRRYTYSWRYYTCDLSHQVAEPVHHPDREKCGRHVHEQRQAPQMREGDPENAADNPPVGGLVGVGSGRDDRQLHHRCQMAFQTLINQDVRELVGPRADLQVEGAEGSSSGELLELSEDVSSGLIWVVPMPDTVSYCGRKGDSRWVGAARVKVISGVR